MKESEQSQERTKETNERKQKTEEQQKERELWNEEKRKPQERPRRMCEKREIDIQKERRRGDRREIVGKWLLLSK